MIWVTEFRGDSSTSRLRIQPKALRRRYSGLSACSGMTTNRRLAGLPGATSGDMMSCNRSTTSVFLAAVLLGACSGGGGGGDGGSTTGGGSDGANVDIIDFLPAKRGLLPDVAQADAAFEGVHHAGAGVCAACHDADVMTVPDESGEDRNVSINKAWRTSVMANAARDPYWHAVVAWEIDEYPSQEDNINDKCTVCHAPMAHDYAEKEGLELRVFGDDEAGVVGIYDSDSNDELFNHAMDGISCSLCHQMDGGNFGDESSFTGGYEIVDARGLESRPAYGQYTDPVSGYMLSQTGNDAEGIPGFLAQHGPHLSTSETCATCHNLDITPVDSEGQELADGVHFSEQANYTEWLYSDYRAGGPLEASCQDCHMPKLDAPAFIAEGTGLEQRDDFAEHTFLGANTVMQTMFRDFGEELGINSAITAAEFDESITRNRAFLETAANVDVTNIARADAAAVDGEAQEELSFDVVIENNAGHKLPTGYHSRRVYLHVLITSDDGVVWQSGSINADGRIAGLSEDTSSESWETHYDVITDPSQVQVYQAVVGNSDGDRTASLLNGNHYLKDNRILPKGYDKTAVAGDPNRLPSFGTFGAAMQDNNFNSGFDTVTYRAKVPAGGDYRVLVELRYQPLAYGHLQELFLKSDRLDVMDMFRTIYDATELRDEVIATGTARLDAN